MVPFAMAFPTSICYVSGSPFVQVQIAFSVIGGDGNGQPIAVGVFFNWDNSMSVSTNIANLKAAIVSDVASSIGITLSTDEVSVLMAVN